MLRKVRSELKVYSNADKEKILRDELAMDRTHMANTRTMLSAIRAGLYFLVTGLTIFAIPAMSTFMFMVWPMVIIGVGIWIWGIREFVLMKRKINACDCPADIR